VGALYGSSERPLAVGSLLLSSDSRAHARLPRSRRPCQNMNLSRLRPARLGDHAEGCPFPNVTGELAGQEAAFPTPATVL
jgi:hypothetical protein